MSDRTHQLLSRLLTAATLAGMAFALAKVVILLPRDIEELRANDSYIRVEMKEMRELKRQDHDLLQRIDERMQSVQMQVREINHKIDRAQ